MVAYAQLPWEIAQIDRVMPQKGPGRPVIFKNMHLNGGKYSMGTRKETSKGIPVMSAEAKWALNPARPPL
jgi:hypothetical protein